MPKNKPNKEESKKLELLELCDGMFFIGESFETIQDNYQKEKIKDISKIGAIVKIQQW